MKLLIALVFIASTVHASASSAPTTAPAKIWATNFAAFATANPNGRWIVAQSAAPAISAQEAEASARASAVDALVPQVRSRLSGRINTKHIRAVVDDALCSDGWIVDRIVHADERPYGTIWHESILVDASSRKLDSLANRINGIAQRQQRRHAAIIGGGLVLSIVAALAFLILNWLTRGYLRMRLALTSITIVLIGVMVIAGLTHP